MTATVRCWSISTRARSRHLRGGRERTVSHGFPPISRQRPSACGEKRRDPSTSVSDTPPPTAIRYLVRHPSGEPTADRKPPGTEATDDRTAEVEDREQDAARRAAPAEPPPPDTSVTDTEPATVPQRA